MTAETTHIGMVAASLSPAAGGVHEAMLGQSQALVRADAKVSWFGPMRTGAPYPNKDMAISIVAGRLIGPERFAFSTNLHQRMLTEAPDVLHLHGLWLPPSWAVLRWRRKTRRPVVISPHGMLDPWALANRSLKKSIALAAFERANLENAACLHALNKAEAEAIRGNGFLNPIAIIPNGVSPLTFLPKDRAEHPREILFLGRLHPKKGLAETLQAWKLLTEREPKIRTGWKLIIAGWDDGGYEATLQKLAAELNIESSVKFVGPLFDEDKDRALRRASAFILASHSEGQPMAVLEAWAYGLPVLMTRACNMPEGFIAGAAIEITNEPNALAASLEEALGSADLSEIGSRGTQLVVECFSWDAVANQHLAVYDWLMGRRDCPDVVVST